MSRFNATSYYRLTSDVAPPNWTMSCGNATTSTVRDVFVNLSNRFNSENWQLYYQQGVYFIRNYSFNTTYHLGLNMSYLSAPIMMPATTELGQQWIIDPWGDGTYRFSNRLIDSGATNPKYMGNIELWSTVLMVSTESGSKWTITPNPDIGPVPAAMLQAYSSIETPAGRPGPTQTSSSTSPTSTSDSNYFDPNHLQSFDKAGIAIGAVTSVVVVIIVLLFWRRYRRHGHGGRGDPAPGPVFREPQHGAAEVIPEPPPAYNPRPTATYTNNGSSVRGDAPDYYAHTSSRKRAADEESIELPPYGRPNTESRSFV